MGETRVSYDDCMTAWGGDSPVLESGRRPAAKASFHGDSRAVWLVALIMLLGSLALSAMLSGCATVAAAEAEVHAALVNVDAAVVTAAQSPEALLALLDALLSLDPSNPTLVSIVTKGKAAIASGDLAAAHNYLTAGITLTGAPKANGT